MKKTFIILLMSIFLISIFLISVVYAVEVSYCCEKTKVKTDGSGGAWCVNAPEEACNISGDLRAVPTSCEATSYCSLGCCYNSQEGTCMENTPQKVCEEPEDGISGGVWSGDSVECDIPQCSLGCCLIGDQAAFVTQTRCKRLSSLYGLETNFRTDISSEIECIASAMPEVKGACVFEKEFEKTCLFLTKKECLERASSDSNVEFHKDYLCSAETLGTNCGPSCVKNNLGQITCQTTCVEGRDEVYFLDSCGNLANIYDASKWNNKEYWTKIKGKAESCGFQEASGNANNKDCGNCDYFLGSTCKAYKKGQDTKPTYGNNICRNLSCEYDGEPYSHGETWCAESKGVGKIEINNNGEISSSSVSNYGKDLPGSRYFRLVCYNNEVTIEPCADFRQEVCLQSVVNEFRTAACRVNMWQDCVSQNNTKDCENIDKRDCQWISSKCVPKYAPGFDFWNTEGDAESTCSLASTTCIVTYKETYEHVFGDKEKECDDNCECMPGESGHEAWLADMKDVCTSLGDCGSSKNYIGTQGYESEEVITIG